MPHFFVPPENIRDTRFTLPAEESRHLATVLRKKRGEEILIFDGAGRNWRARVESVSPERVDGVILAEEPFVTVPWTLRLFQGLPKGDKFDWILEKLTELGAAEIIPLHTERSVPRLSAEKLPARVRRWEKIVLSAAKQSGQSRVPKVRAPVDFAEALQLLPPGSLTLLPWEGEENVTLKQALRGNNPSAVINIFIGPEGGFSPAEVRLAQGRGAVPVTFGRLIMRTETAALFAASALLYELGS
jgi:16S rRNA (uracil1498-N3)-methyltransferase